VIVLTRARVTSHLENLEKSGNSKLVREKSAKMEKVRGSEIRCFFKL